VSLRGALHYDSGTVRQDAFTLGLSDDGAFVVASIADGVSQGAVSHLGAEWASQQAAVITRDMLTHTKGDLAGVDWNHVAAEVRSAVRYRAEQHLGSSFTKRAGGQADPTEVPDREYAKVMGTTAEVLVVAVSPDEAGTHRAVRVVIAGDGSGMVLDPKHGWWVLGMGKAAGGDIASNAVLTLPLDPGPPTVQHWDLQPGQAVAAVTDGFGDPFGDGSTPVASYLHEVWRRPVRSATELLRTASFVRLQADDDRTVVVVWACGS